MGDLRSEQNSAGELLGLMLEALARNGDSVTAGCADRSLQTSEAHGYNHQLRRAATRSHAGSKPMQFNTWIAEIEEMVTFDVDAEMWRKYFDVGLTPLAAIEQHRTDEEV